MALLANLPTTNKKTARSNLDTCSTFDPCLEFFSSNVSNIASLNNSITGNSMKGFDYCINENNLPDHFLIANKDFDCGNNIHIIRSANDKDCFEQFTNQDSKSHTCISQEKCRECSNFDDTLLHDGSVLSSANQQLYNNSHINCTNDQNKIAEEITNCHHLLEFRLDFNRFLSSYTVLKNFELQKYYFNVDLIDGIIPLAVSPWMFYFQDFKLVHKLRKLHYDINFYIDNYKWTKKELKKWRLNLKLGSVVAAQYKNDNKWYRGNIIAINFGKVADNCCYEIYFVDYGEYQLLSKSKIHPLPFEFAQLPMTAVCCILHNVSPVNEPDVWPTLSTFKFKKLLIIKSMMLKKITFHKKCSNELPLTFVNLYANEGKIYSEHPSPLDFIQYLSDHNALYAHNDSKIFCWFANYCAAQDCIRQTQFDDFIPTLKFFQSISCADEKVDCLELHDKELKSLSKENLFKMEDNHALIIKLLKNINKQFKNKYDLSIFSSFLDKCSSIKWKEQDIDHCIFGTEKSQISYTKIISSGDESTNLTCKTSSIPSNNYGNVESHDDASDRGGPLNEILHDGTVNIQTVEGIEEIIDCDSDEERHLNEINQIKVHTHSKFENNKKDRNNNDIKIRAKTLNNSTYHDAAANELGHDFCGSKININDNISPTDFTILNSIDIEDKRSYLYLDGDSKLKTTHFIVNDENKDVDNNGLIFETELEPKSTTDITRANNDKNIFLSKTASPYLFKTIKVINNPMKVVVSHVVSPFLFWIHIIKNDLHENSSSPSSVIHKMSETADSIAECATSENQKVFLCNEMNKLSMDLKQNCEIVLNHGCLNPFSKDACLPNVPCLFNDVQEKIFYRAEILDVKRNEDNENITVRLSLVDLGKDIELTSLNDVFHLDQYFVDHSPRLAVCCQLDGVEPLANNDWSTEALNYFMAKMKSDDLSAFLSSKYELDDCICGTRENPLLISLFEINDESCISFISVQMCDMGLAQLSKITLEEEVVANNLSTCLLNGMKRVNCEDKFSNEDLPSEISKFMQDGMNDEYLSYRNSYLVDTDNPGVATVSYEAKDEKRVCKYFDKAGGCWWGRFCKYEHTRAQPTSVTADRQLLFYENFNLAVIELVESEWYYVSISVMVNPQKFFVVLPFANVAAEQVTLRVESPLQMLMESLNSCYNSKIYQDHDLTLYNIGELVVARSQTFELWHRARVLEHYSHEEDLCQVYYVDYGNTEVIPINRLRCIEPQFIEIPYQAIQSSLPIVPADSLSWSQQAIDYFASLVADRYCLAQINRSQSFRDFPCEMSLYTLTSSENICDLMIERGYAKYCSSFNSFSQNSFSDDVACENPLGSAKFWPG